MAFQSAAGYNNLANGNFSPIIYSKKAQMAFRRSSVIQAVTNSDYFGEIAGYGDTVKVIKEPSISVLPYARGTTVTAQDLVDDEFSLTVDKANYMSFKVDDIEQKHAHHNWGQMATDQGGYRLADAMDSEVLTYMTTQVGVADGATSDMLIGTTTTPVTVSTTGTPNYSPLSLMARLKLRLDLKNVPDEGRWFIGDPVFYEKLSDENSKLINRDYAEVGILRNGRVTDGIVRGFALYSSNNLPVVGTGPEATSGSNGGWLLAGHMSSTATAEQITQTESFRSGDSFADIVRGLHVYGRKVLRGEALVGAVYQSV